MPCSYKADEVARELIKGSQIADHRVEEPKLKDVDSEQVQAAVSLIRMYTAQSSGAGTQDKNQIDVYTSRWADTHERTWSFL